MLSIGDIGLCASPRLASLGLRATCGLLYFDATICSTENRLCFNWHPLSLSEFAENHYLNGLVSGETLILRKCVQPYEFGIYVYC